MRKTKLAMSVILVGLLLSNPTESNYGEKAPLPVKVYSLSSHEAIRKKDKQAIVKINDMKKAEAKLLSLRIAKKVVKKAILKKVKVKKAYVPVHTTTPIKIVHHTYDRTPSRGGYEHESTVSGSYETFKLTAYNLDQGSCGKSQGSSGFGVTASGYNLSNEDITSRKIAVDPNVIRLGTQINIEFPDNYRHVTLSNGSRFDLNGTYTAVDTGGAIKGNRIDLFVGGTDRFTRTLSYDIGVRFVKVRRLRRN